MTLLRAALLFSLTGFSLTGCFASTGSDLPAPEDMPRMPCALAPQCAAAWTEVSSCEGRVDCYEETQCGMNIHCSTQTVCDESPVCLAGETEVEECASDACTERSAPCGQTIQCEAAALCDGRPVCPGGEEAVDECDVSREGCRALSMCGETVLCAPAADSCFAPSPCPEAYVDIAIEIETCDPPEGATFCAPAVDDCGVAVGCEVVIDARASDHCLPECAQGEVRIGRCPPGQRCVGRVACGLPIVCVSARL